MRTLLERYIARTVILSTAIATLAIVGISILLLLLGEMKEIGKGDYNILQSFAYVVMRLPSQVYQFSPMLILLGTVIGLSILTANRELIIMRASGFAMNRLIRNIMYIAGGVIFAFSLVGELVGPKLSYYAAVNKEYAQNAGQAVITSTGTWYHLGNNFIHVEHVVDRQLLQGVTRFQFNNQHQLMFAYFAKALVQQNKEWEMQDVVKTSFLPDRIKSESFAELPWELAFNANLLNIGLVEPSDLSLPKLAKFIRYLERNHLQANQYKYEFWQRVLQPLASLVMILLSIPFVLGAQIRTSLGWRVIIAIMAGFAFFLLNAVLSQMSIVYQLPVFLAALIPILLFSGIGIFTIRRLLS